MDNPHQTEQTSSRLSSPNTDHEKSHRTKLTRKQRRRQQREHQLSNDPQPNNASPLISIPPAMSLTTLPRKIFVASIGNPAPYTYTLHSAGHTILSLLPPVLGYPPFQKSRHHANGLLSPSPNPDELPWTLWQSPLFMNESGKAARKAWEMFLRDIGGAEGEEGRRAVLVVVHDELELAPGKVKVKTGRGSARGHNGLKSCLEQLPASQSFTRIGVGIGRPASRDSTEVANYVLRKMTAVERRKIEEEALPVVVKALRDLAFAS